MEIAEDGHGSVEWLDEPETVGGSPFWRRKVRIAVVAAAVVAVLAGTSLVLRANHDFGPGPDSHAAPVGLVDWRKVLPSAGVGMWTTSDSVVVAMVDGLTAYSLSSGEKLWSWAPPAGQGVCAVSPSISQGRGVVAYGALAAAGTAMVAGLPCAAAQAVDVGDGKAVWSEPVDLTQGGGPIFASVVMGELSISGGFVVAPYGQSGVISIDAATGARLWTSSQLPGAGVGDLGPCDHGAQALDGEVYVIVGNSCSGAGAAEVGVAVYNAAKIAAPQVLPLPGDDSPHCAAYARTIFATAADVFVTCETYNGQSFPAYAIPSGPAAQLIPLGLQETGGIDPADVALTAGQLELAGGFVSGGDLLVGSASGSASPTALTSFDLTSGMALWRYTFRAGTRFYPLGPGGAGAQGVQISGDDWTLLSISPTSGIATSTVPLDSTALSDSGIDGSFDDVVVGSHVVVGELGANATLVVSTL